MERLTRLQRLSLHFWISAKSVHIPNASVLLVRPQSRSFKITREPSQFLSWARGKRTPADSQSRDCALDLVQVRRTAKEALRTFCSDSCMSGALVTEGAAFLQPVAAERKRLADETSREMTRALKAQVSLPAPLPTIMTRYRDTSLRFLRPVARCKGCTAFFRVGRIEKVAATWTCWAPLSPAIYTEPGAPSTGICEPLCAHPRCPGN